MRVNTHVQIYKGGAFTQVGRRPYSAPVIAFAWISFTAGLLIEINRFFPDPLVFSF